MSKWIKLIDRTPLRQGVYLCIALQYDGTLVDKDLLWTGDGGFQPLSYGRDNESHPIEMDVSHWLDLEIPADMTSIIKEAESLIIETEVFFHSKGLSNFAFNNKIGIFAMYGNATEYIITGVPEATLSEMRLLFKSQMKHKHIRKL